MELFRVSVDISFLSFSFSVPWLVYCSPQLLSVTSVRCDVQTYEKFPSITQGEMFITRRVEGSSKAFQAAPSRKWHGNDSYLGLNFWKIFSPPLLSPVLRMKVIIFQHCCGAGKNWMQLELVKMPQILLFLSGWSHVSWLNTSPCCYKQQSTEKLVLIISHYFYERAKFQSSSLWHFLMSLSLILFFFWTTHLVMENHPSLKKQWQCYLLNFLCLFC